MKTWVLVCTICFLFSLAAVAEDDKPAIEKVVHNWNDIHNTRNASELRDLYNYTVLFYGKYLSRAECIDEKRSFFQNQYQQKIGSPIKINYYASGTIKCSFSRELNSNDSIKEYPSYLLLEKWGNKYIITGESDLITDQNLHFQPNLGQEVRPATNSSVLRIFVVAIALLAAGAICYFIFRKKKVIKSSHKVIAIAPMPELPRQMEQKKRDPFEKFVVEKFDPANFEVLEWRSQTDPDGKTVKSNRHPDLEIRFKNGDYSIVFDVECKWRKDFYNDKLLWAKPHQWDTYNEFANKTGKPVFVIIGIGGDPGCPENVFVLPLNKIYSTELSIFQLRQYKWLTKESFLFDPEKRMLS